MQAALAELDASAHRLAEMQGDGASAPAGSYRPIESELPWLARQIRADHAANRFAGWASSTVIDENTHAPVITRYVFDELHALAGIDAQWPVGNAGLLHCYGYLLSTAVTPHGLKRDRWISPHLATALGQEVDTFTPWVGDTSLLSRVEATIVPLLNNPPEHALANHTSTTVPDAAGRTYTTQTVVVQHQGFAALAYGVVAPRGGAASVLPVTAFPVTATTEWLTELASNTTRLRFNAVGSESAAEVR